MAAHRNCDGVAASTILAFLKVLTPRCGTSAEMGLHPLQRPPAHSVVRSAARWRTLRPPYVPGGFWVANSMKCGCGLIWRVDRIREGVSSKACSRAVRD